MTEKIVLKKAIFDRKNLVVLPAPKPKHKLQLVTLDIKKCVTESPPVLDFVLPGLLAGSVGSFIAPGGTGKSFFMLQTAIAIAGGKSPFFNIEKMGPVLYLAAEDPAEILHARIHGLCNSNTTGSVECFAENLRLVPCGGMDILEKGVAESIIDAGKNCRLIILDTLRRFHALDENAGGEMVQVIGKFEEIAKATGAALVFIHHTNKTSANSGNGGSQGASRGSSVLVDNVRWLGFLAKMTAEEAVKQGREGLENQFVRFGISKINYGEGVSDIWLIRGEGGGLVNAFGSDKFEDESKRIGENEDESESDDVIDENRNVIEDMSDEEIKKIEGWCWGGVSNEYPF